MNTTTAINIFLKSLRTLNYSERTLVGYRQDLEMFCNLSGDSNLNIDELTLKHVESFLCYSVKNSQSPSASYRNRRLSCLRSFFRFLNEKGLLSAENDPTKSIKFARVPYTEPSPLSYSEYLSILKSVRQTADDFLRTRNWSIIVLLYNSGLRLFELAGLDLEQIDLETARITSLLRKGGKIVDLPINQNVVLSLSAWLLERDKPEGENALFTTRKKQRISTRMIERVVTKYAKQAGITRSITPHTFRHSYCTEIQKRGAGMYVAQELMNHSSIKTTSRYSHVNEQAMRLAVDSLVDPKQWPDGEI